VKENICTVKGVLHELSQQPIVSARHNGSLGWLQCYNGQVSGQPISATITHQ